MKIFVVAFLSLFTCKSLATSYLVDCKGIAKNDHEEVVWQSLKENIPLGNPGFGNAYRVVPLDNYSDRTIVLDINYDYRKSIFSIMITRTHGVVGFVPTNTGVKAPIEIGSNNTTIELLATGLTVSNPVDLPADFLGDNIYISISCSLRTQ